MTNNDTQHAINHSGQSASQGSRRRTAILLILVFVILAAAITLLLNRPADKQVTNPVVRIKITSRGFEPATVSVKKGSRITWTNTDSKLHQIQANPHPTGDSLPGLKSEILNNGQSYGYVVTSTKPISYHDHLNPTTNGSIDIQK